MKLLLLVLALSTSLLAGELPNTPSADRTPKLLTRENVIAFSLNAALRSADAVITCRNLASGGVEWTAPSQSCAGTTAWVMSGVPIQIVGVWFLQRTGHRKMARVLAWGMPASDAAYLSISLAHR